MADGGGVKAADPFAVDLFGAPVQPLRDRRGRPSFAKNKENQELVAVLRARGWSQSRIAAYMQCDEKTLRKHFSRELAIGADMVEADAMVVLIAKMKQGHVPATRTILEIIEEGRAAPPMPRQAEADKPLGKKAQAEIDARKPSEGWGDVLPQVH